MGGMPFSSGDFVAALAETLAAESPTRVLYPDDTTSMGQGLRFVQEEPETRAALDLIFSGHFSRYDPAVRGRNLGRKAVPGLPGDGGEINYRKATEPEGS